jgi:hypothetical protein
LIFKLDLAEGQTASALDEMTKGKKKPLEGPEVRNQQFLISCIKPGLNNYIQEGQFGVMALEMLMNIQFRNKDQNIVKPHLGMSHRISTPGLTSG